MWQHQSPPQQGDGFRSRKTRGGTRALLSREAGSRAMRHVGAPEPSSAGRCGPELLDTGHHVLACPALCLSLVLVCGGTRSVGY
jgi:hypothetical protein